MESGLKIIVNLFLKITYFIFIYSQGCNHDRELYNIPDENEDSNFGFNHCDTCVTSMMSYENHCKSLQGGQCTQVTTIPYFSNPNIEFTAQDENNQQYTFAIGDSKRNNAQMIRNSKKGIAANYVKGQYLFDVNTNSNSYSFASYTDVEFIVEVSFFKSCSKF